MHPLPVVSVVIPMRNEANHIAACVDSVFAQDYPADRLEVIVVDGDSDDDSAGVLRRYGTRIRLLRNPSRIVPTAMNIGIAAAQGQIIARVDAHTVIAPDYIRTGVETLQRTGADNVGGPMHAVGGGRTGDAIALAMSSRFGIGAYFHFGTAEREVGTVYMGMYPRRVFERIGLFDEELVRNQDDELNYRLRKAGGRIWFTPQMRSRYQNRQSLKGLARQFFQYGLWKIRVLQKHPRQMRLRHFAPPAFVLTVAATALTAPWSVAASRGLAVVIAAYGAASVVAAVAVARRHGWHHVAPLVAAFAVMHCSWGSGLLTGALRFAHRWTGEERRPPQLRPALMVERDELVGTTATEQRTVVRPDHRVREGGI
jgi:succinoglycan biosynthesis protein ExoA